MVRSILHKSVALGALTVISAASLAGCASGSTSGDSVSTGADRQAAFLASQVCVVNDTDKTILSVGEFDMNRVADSHPDPTGPLEPGKKWCTNGYDAFAWDQGKTADATVELKFSEDEGDYLRFAVSNWVLSPPIMFYGQQKLSRSFQPGSDPWEKDITMPDPLSSLSQTEPSHDYHLRRLRDSEFFKEWLITVRS